MAGVAPGRSCPPCGALVRKARPTFREHVCPGDGGSAHPSPARYIDLNPLRAGIVSRPEDYRWNSISYHLQSGNRDKFLSTDFGLMEYNVKSEKERIRRYRRYVYEAGAVNRP